MALKIPRSIRWVDAKSGRMGMEDEPRIRPRGFDDLPEEAHPQWGRFVCAEAAVAKDDHFGLVMHNFEVFNWFRRSDGSLVRYAQYEDGPGRDFSRWHSLQSNQMPEFVRRSVPRGWSQDSGHVPVFYFLNCTVVMGVEIEDLDAAFERRHPRHRDTPFSVLLGAAYTLPPQSNHAAISLIPKIKGELEMHTQMMAMATGWKLELGEVATEPMPPR